MEPTVREAIAPAHLTLHGDDDVIRYLQTTAPTATHAPPPHANLTLAFADALTDDHLEKHLPNNLRSLKLDYCHALTDDAVRTVAKRSAEHLTTFSVYSNQNLTSAAAVTLSLHCPSLTSLSFSGCMKIGSAGITALAARCRKLKSLDLTRLPLLDDVALGTLVRANPNLERLVLYADSRLSDEPIARHLAPSCRSLRHLDCTGLNSPGISDDSLEALAAHCARLEHLILSWCTRITDHGACAVARRCPLSVLSVHGVLGVGEPLLSALEAGCASTLVALDVRGCVGISPPAAREPAALVARLPRLETFMLHS